MGKSTKDQRDHFYRQGKQEGYRARSAYKLLQLDEQYGLLGRPGHALGAQIAGQALGEPLPGDAQTKLVEALGESLGTAAFASLSTRASPPGNVIDLCAAPGSWSQVLSRALGKSGATIVAVDLQSMAPLDGVTQVLGDITTEATAAAVEHAFTQSQRTPGAKADLIVCDGAPDVTGIQQLDEYVHSQLLMSAVTMALRMLRPDGTFVAKVFAEPHSASTRMLLAQFRRLFEHVELAKPGSSRTSSAEHFVVALGFSAADAPVATTQHNFLGDLQGYNA